VSRRSFLVGCLCAALAAGTARAAVIDVPPTSGALAAASAAAGPGDVLRLAPGRHEGPIVIDRPVILEAGSPGAEIVGTGTGSVVRVKAPTTVIRGLGIRGSGTSLETMDSGIFLEQTATGAQVEDNRLERNLFGVYVHGARDTVVKGNVIRGRPDLHLSEAGNGVSVWNAPGTVVRGNDIAEVRDGIFTVTNKNNQFLDNQFRALRFAIHFMYTSDTVVAGNVSIGNHTGYAIMFSDRVEVARNRSESHRDHGLMLHAVNSSSAIGNTVLGGGMAAAIRAAEPADDAEEKCLFLFNANKNRITGNRFESCRIGVHHTAGSDRNVIAGNAFIGNRTQVKFVGTRRLEWSEKGRGNYWSDHAAFDLDGDGIADEPYLPNDLIDQIVWTTPLAKALLNSPGVQLVRWSQAQFPALLPGGVVDTAPLMVPPEPR
jgi:nitrous oxidase accessory protein